MIYIFFDNYTQSAPSVGNTTPVIITMTAQQCTAIQILPIVGFVINIPGYYQILIAYLHRRADHHQLIYNE